MKIVAVSQRVDAFPERAEVRDALDQRLNMFLVAAGYLPVPVPNGLHPDAKAWLARVSPQAIILSGGNDIGQCPARDTTESALLDHAQKHSLPVLGICRGMQMMAHWMGVGLRAINGHVRTRHTLSGELTHTVNSYHGFTLLDCPPGCEILAYSEDGAIEAIRHQTLPWEGWMWHPEREAHFDAHDIQRIQALFGV